MHVVYSRLFLRVASVARGKSGDYRIVGDLTYRISSNPSIYKHNRHDKSDPCAKTWDVIIVK